MTITSTSFIRPYASTLEELRASLDGQVITPDDQSYDLARQAWNLDRRSISCFDHCRPDHQGYCRSSAICKCPGYGYCCQGNRTRHHP